MMISLIRAGESRTSGGQPIGRKKWIISSFKPGVAIVSGAAVHRSGGGGGQWHCQGRAGFYNHIRIITCHGDWQPIGPGGSSAADGHDADITAARTGISQIDANYGAG